MTSQMIAELPSQHLAGQELDGGGQRFCGLAQEMPMVSEVERYSIHIGREHLAPGPHGESQIIMLKPWLRMSNLVREGSFDSDGDIIMSDDESVEPVQPVHELEVRFPPASAEEMHLLQLRLAAEDVMMIDADVADMLEGRYPIAMEPDAPGCSDQSKAAAPNASLQAPPVLQIQPYVTPQAPDAILSPPSPSRPPSPLVLMVSGGSVNISFSGEPSGMGRP